MLQKSLKWTCYWFFLSSQLYWELLLVTIYCWFSYIGILLKKIIYFYVVACKQNPCNVRRPFEDYVWHNKTFDLCYSSILAKLARFVFRTILQVVIIIANKEHFLLNKSKIKMSFNQVVSSLVIVEVMLRTSSVEIEHLPRSDMRNLWNVLRKDNLILIF